MNRIEQLRAEHEACESHECDCHETAAEALDLLDRARALLETCECRDWHGERHELLAILGTEPQPRT